MRKRDIGYIDPISYDFVSLVIKYNSALNLILSASVISYSLAVPNLFQKNNFFLSLDLSLKYRDNHHGYCLEAKGTT